MIQVENNNDSPVETRESKIRPSFIDWSVPGIIIIFAIIVVGLSLNMKLAPESLVGDSMQPRTFPIFLMVLMLALTAVLIFDMVKHGVFLRLTILWQTWVSIALFGLFVSITLTLDMFLALAITLFCMTITFGEKRLWIALVVGIVTPLIIFFTFDLGFGTRFPRGILTEFYY